MSSGAVGAGIAALAITAESPAAGSAVGLLLVAARRLALLLKILWTALVSARAVLLIEIGLIASAYLPVVGPHIRIRPSVLVLRLVVFRAEIGCGNVAVAGIAVEIIGPIVVPVDVVRVDVVSIDVIHVHVIPVDVVDVPVVVVVAVHERVGIGDVHISVVDNRRVMPTATPGVPTPPAATVVCDRGADRNPDPEGDQTRGYKCPCRWRWWSYITRVNDNGGAVYHRRVIGRDVDDLGLGWLYDDRLWWRLNNGGLRCGRSAGRGRRGRRTGRLVLDGNVLLLI